MSNRVCAGNEWYSSSVETTSVLFRIGQGPITSRLDTEVLTKLSVVRRLGVLENIDCRRDKLVLRFDLGDDGVRE